MRTVLIVSIEYGASPETRFARLAPPSCSRPLPFEWRASISAASRGRFETIALPCSFSHQRNAGMSWFEPCRIPACMAAVWDDQSHSQPIR